MITRVLANTGAALRDRGMMYKVVDQLVLMYGIESWVVIGAILKVLEGFHRWEDRRITGMTATRGAVREWEYPPVVAVLEATGLYPIMDYIRRRQATIAVKVACRPIYEL